MLPAPFPSFPAITFVRGLECRNMNDHTPASCGPRFGVDVVVRKVNSRETRTEYYPRVDHPNFGRPAPLHSYGEAFEQAYYISGKLYHISKKL